MREPEQVNLTPALELRSVVRDYGTGTVVGPVSCAIRPGEFVSLLGPSGCGKTTLLRCVAGFDRIDSGAIRVAGADVGSLPPYRRGVGLVFQNYALFPHLTVAGNVAFGLKLRKKLSAGELAQRVSQALAIVGLEHLGDRYPAQLSGGQQQRVAIARSVVLNPALLLLDEPLSNLDFKLRIQMREELRKLQRQLGTTFIYVTHDQTEALAMSDRIIVLSGGRIAQVGTPREIYESPANRFVADFIGASNLLQVASAALVDGGVITTLDNGGVITCGRGAVEPGASAWVSIRPESIKVAPAAGGTSLPNVFRAQVISRTFCGDKDEVAIRLLSPSGSTPTAQQLLMHLKPQEALGDEIAVHVDPRDAVLVADGA